ncbi:MAG: arylamine N-acetyltransferase [Synechococcaceae cyanobacterium SM2_3_1]|nr:arylamine N-acetyltransferase [Synechococcaceae cyanobacterium SM2_3_1]
MNSTDITAYLDRIQYSGTCKPSVATLSALQSAHLRMVPFENLDILSGVPLQLETAALFTKIIKHARGGICYELNGLFAELLKGLGFQVTLLSAQVASADGSHGPDFDHLVLLVHLTEPWIVDVGFGDSCLIPLPLQGPSPAPGYRLQQDPLGWSLQQRFLTRWQRLFSFTLHPRSLEAFASRCQFHQTSHASLLNQIPLCTQVNSSGRLTLSGRTLTRTVGSDRSQQVLTEPEVNAVLLHQFGIDLSHPRHHRLKQLFTDSGEKLSLRTADNRSQ